MKVLSVRQPWAWAIIHGGKDVENRTWRSRHRGPLLIHAARTVDYDDTEDMVRLVQATTGEDPDRIWGRYTVGLRVGAVVGVAEMVDCVESHESPWFYGPFGFVFRNPRSFFPRRLRGLPGIFETDAFEVAL